MRTRLCGQWPHTHLHGGLDAVGQVDHRQAGVLTEEAGVLPARYRLVEDVHGVVRGAPAWSRGGREDTRESERAKLHTVLVVVVLREGGRERERERERVTRLHISTRVILRVKYHFHSENDSS